MAQKSYGLKASYKTFSNFLQNMQQPKGEKAWSANQEQIFQQPQAQQR